MRRNLFIAAAALLVAPASGWSEAPAKQTVAAARERFLAVDGGRNFRDLGGYHGAGGRTVRWGLLYRSGSLGGLTPAGQARIDGINPAAIIDLRSDEERATDNGPWLANRRGYWFRHYSISRGDMARLFSQSGGTEPVNLRAMMQGAYRTLPKEQAASYRALFAALLADKSPVVVNCTAGKDRTGIASALVLTALGVPYAAVRRDFLLSNDAPGMKTLSSALSGPMAKLSPQSVKILAGVEGAYLDTAFAGMRKDYGSVDGYLSRELGMGPREIARLRARMLSPAHKH